MRLRFILPLLIALLWPTFALGAFTEFYCNASTGSNMNGGSDANTSPSYSATNGGWNSGTGVFTPTSGDPSASGVSVGQFAHVFADGSTTPTFIGRVTSVNSTTVTVSTTAKSGTAPGTSGTGISINVGGVWKGPNGAVNFPFGFVTNTLTDASGNATRINLKNNATYAVTAAVAHSNAGPLAIQGYTTTVGDGGVAILDGGTSGSSYILFQLGSTDALLCDMIFHNNGASGTQPGVYFSASKVVALRVKSYGMMGAGFNNGGADNAYIECEATGNGLNGWTAGTVRTLHFRCYSHDNSGIGFNGAGNGGYYVDCIADSNTGDGFTGHTAPGYQCFYGCDFYNNGGDGIDLINTTSGVFTIENCNFVKNAGYGINGSGSASRVGVVTNCGFGAGTQANASGAVTGLKSMVESGSVTYPSNLTPWNDPANGDFTITLAAAKGAGRGTFATGLTSTVGYPDIGAAQHQDSGGGGVSRARVVNSRD